MTQPIQSYSMQSTQWRADSQISNPISNQSALFSSLVSISEILKEKLKHETHYQIVLSDIEALLDQQQFQKAIIAANKVLCDLLNNDTSLKVKLHTYVVRAYMSSKYYLGAVMAADNALSCAHNDHRLKAKLYVVRAFACIGNNDYQEATSSLEEALSFEPEESSLLAQIGLVFARVYNIEKKYPDAIKAAKKGLSFQCEVSDIEAALFYELAISYFMTGQREQAMDACQNGLSLPNLAQRPKEFLMKFKEGITLNF